MGDGIREGNLLIRRRLGRRRSDSSGGGRRLGDRLLLALPAAAAIALLFVTPIVVFAVYSFLSGSVYGFSAHLPFTFANYRAVVSDPTIGRLATNSVIVGFAVAGVSLAIGLPTAFWLRYCAGRFQQALIFLLVLAMFAGYLVRIYAWRTILGQDGILNDALQRIGLTSHPLGFLVFSRFAIVVALVQIVLPFVVLLLFAGFRPIEPRILESAQDLGAGFLTRWRRVVLPLIAVPAGSAFMLCILIGTSDYVTPLLLGAPGQLTVGVQIQRYFQELGEYPFGAALAMLVLLCYGILYAAFGLGFRLLRLRRLEWQT